jgi:predicted ATPase
LSVFGIGNRGAAPRQQTLEATIRWSYRLLTEAERLLWARLSVFAGGLAVEAAIEVCSGPVLPAVQIVELLANLVEKSILKRDAGAQPTRYMFVLGRQSAHDPGGLQVWCADDAVDE